MRTIEEIEKEYVDNIVKATLKLVQAHRENENKDKLFDKYEKYEYLTEDLMEEMVQLGAAILEADHIGCFMCNLPVNDQSDTKAYFSKLDETLHNLPEKVRNEQQKQTEEMKG